MFVLYTDSVSNPFLFIKCNRKYNKILFLHRKVNQTNNVSIGNMLHQHCLGYMATFRLYQWRKNSGDPACIISGMSGHPSRITNVPLTSRIVSSHDKSEVPGEIGTISSAGEVILVNDSNHLATATSTCQSYVKS